MSGLLDRLARHWRDRAAVRAEHVLEPTWRRRLDRLPQRWADRRVLRDERRPRRRQIGERIDEASSRSWGKDYLP
jgi:hypothetical protein